MALLKKTLPAVWPDAPLSLEEVQAHLIAQWPSLAKDPTSRPWATYDAFEVFGGTHAIAKAFGPFKGNFMDYPRDKTNIHEVQGLLRVAEEMCKLKEDGVLVVEPTRGSWIWVSRGTSLRGVVTCCVVLLHLYVL